MVKTSKVKGADPTQFAGVKRPGSSYFLFSDDMRAATMEKLKAEAAAKNESFKVASVAKAIGEQWKALDAAKKAEYEAKAKALKEQYEKDLAAWKETDSYKEYLKAQGTVDIENQKRKQAKMVAEAKPANCPQRPSAAYFVFSTEVTPKVVEELKAAGKVTMAARAEKVKALWAALPQEEKDTREKAYQDAKTKYEEDMKAFQETAEFKEWDKLKNKAKTANENVKKRVKISTDPVFAAKEEARLEKVRAEREANKAAKEASANAKDAEEEEPVAEEQAEEPKEAEVAADAEPASSTDAPEASV